MSRCARCNQEVTAGYVLCDRCYKKMDGVREDCPLPEKTDIKKRAKTERITVILEKT